MGILSVAEVFFITLGLVATGALVFLIWSLKRRRPDAREHEGLTSRPIKQGPVGKSGEQVAAATCVDRIDTTAFTDAVESPAVISGPGHAVESESVEEAPVSLIPPSGEKVLEVESGPDLGPNAKITAPVSETETWSPVTPGPGESEESPANVLDQSGVDVQEPSSAPVLEPELVAGSGAEIADLAGSDITTADDRTVGDEHEIADASEPSEEQAVTVEVVPESEATVETQSPTPSTEIDAVEPAIPVKTAPKYHPQFGGGGVGRTTPISAEVHEERERALSIEVRMVFDKRDTCFISLLPQRQRELPVDLTVHGSEGTHELSALQDEWYEDVSLPEIGALLRRGIEWETTAARGKRRLRWVLSGREVYVLSGHEELSGFISRPRLVLEERHVILCTVQLVDQVLEVLREAGASPASLIDESRGVPPGWVALTGITPSQPVPLKPEADILNVLRPSADVEIVLHGGIRVRYATWLAGHPPKIRLRGVIIPGETPWIDGIEATRGADGGFTAAGWDLIGRHIVSFADRSRSYEIIEGLEDWAGWNAYPFARAGICGASVRGLTARETDRMVFLPIMNPVVIGPAPGQIVYCPARTGVRSPVNVAFVPFDAVWGLPLDALHADKRTARIRLVGKLQPVSNAVPRRVARGQERARIVAWFTAILNAGRKGLLVEPDARETSVIWRDYQRAARAVRKAVVRV